MYLKQPLSMFFLFYMQNTESHCKRGLPLFLLLKIVDCCKLGVGVPTSKLSSPVVHQKIFFFHVSIHLLLELLLISQALLDVLFQLQNLLSAVANLPYLVCHILVGFTEMDIAMAYSNTHCFQQGLGNALCN